jgi:hypothetical protein
MREGEVMAWDCGKGEEVEKMTTCSLWKAELE